MTYNVFGGTLNLAQSMIDLGVITSKSIKQLVYLYGSLKPGLKQVCDMNYNAVAQLHRDNH